MAGGVSTAALAAAVCDAGGLGFLAGGYKSAHAMGREITELRTLTDAPFGVNLFVPGPQDTDIAAFERYRAELEPEARRYGVELAQPPAHDDDEFEQKLSVLITERVPVAGFTFGCPPAPVIERLHEAGIEAVVTVTSAQEAAIAASAGADVLCVQGPEAGGHRGGFTPLPAEQAQIGLLPLTTLVRQAVDVPLIAAGGIADGHAVAAALACGALAAQLGTAFLRTPQSGAHPLHKAALIDPGFPGTSVTSAFTGRPARCLTNRFAAAHRGPVP
ncbi:nitronate monooxygenase, partial [Actinocrinis puniceicyclus]